MPNPQKDSAARKLPTRERHCVVCDSKDGVVLYEARLPEFQGDAAVLHYHYEQTVAKNLWHYRIVRCKSCGHIYGNPIFEEELVEESYLSQRHDNQFGVAEELLLRTNRGYADLVTEYLPPRDKRNLQVDIGCDTGIFIRATRDLGFRKVVGIEPGVDSANQARKIPGIEVMQKLFDPADFQEGSIDFLNLIHVLDHLSQPRQIIREIRPLISKGGVVFAIVHNIDSLIAKVSGESWPVLNLVHLDHYSPTSLRRLFEAEGYRVLAVKKTKNHFPLSHLIRFCPLLPTKMRDVMIKTVVKPPFNDPVLGLRLGNIAVLATVD